MAENPRIDALRRRVEQDPASIAFAQLGEELRRSGDARQAIAICRAGLAVHPGYISAHVTLGRALLETGELTRAELEFKEVAKRAPENLAALRGLAEIHLRRGEHEEALHSYKAALELAPNAPDLERSVEALTRKLAPVMVTAPRLERFLDAIHTYRQRRAV